MNFFLYFVVKPPDKKSGKVFGLFFCYFLFVLLFKVVDVNNSLKLA